MSKLNQKGASSVLLVSTVSLVILLILSFSFAIWAYAKQLDYKNNSDQKVAAAVKVAQAQTSTAKDNQFVEQAKSPLKTYKGPETYGSVTINYPKTWSGYVDTTGNPLEAYFQPDVVPGIDSNTPYALRIEVTADSYSQEMSQFVDRSSSGNLKISAYRAAKVPSTLGSKLEGQIKDNVQGILVIFPLRDKSLKVWTESSQYSSDFNNFILPNLSFSP